MWIRIRNTAIFFIITFLAVECTVTLGTGNLLLLAWDTVKLELLYNVLCFFCKDAPFLTAFSVYKLV